MAFPVSGVSSFLLVGLGGAAGAMARFQLVRMLPSGGWPWGTFLVNVGGSLLMGLLAGALMARGGNEPLRLLLGVGLLGGFTTFSAFSLDTMRLLERGLTSLALGYALASVILSVCAVALGLMIAKALA